MSRISDLAGFTTSLSSTQDLSVGVITATTVQGTTITGDSATFSGNVTVGGTITYQDATNMDVLGISTFQQGIQVLANGLDVTGIATFKTGTTVAGVSTATLFSGALTGNVTGNVDGNVNAGIVTSNDYLGNFELDVFLFL